MRIGMACATLFVLLAVGGMDPDMLRGLGLLTLVFLALGLLWGLLGLLPGRRRRGRPPGTAPARRDRGAGITPVPTVVVDGSNVMHWNGDPSALVLGRVIKALIDKGERPHVYFDANAGYKLADRFMNAAELAEMLSLPAAHVTVVDRGEPADPVLLEHAVRIGARVVTNDRFLDWKLQFPAIGNRGFLVKGRWQEGAPILQL